MIIFFLIASIVFSTVRNLMSKNISDLSFGSKSFFRTQAVIFACGSITLLIFSGNPFKNIAAETLLYSIIYGILLLSAQYCYTASLKYGNIGICSTVYSLGFVLPTLSGSIFWDETLSVLNAIGIALVIPAIIISGKKNSKENMRNTGNKYIIPLVIAMLSSGGLGIMQKVQQSSSFAEQKNAFIIIAFGVSAAVSLVLSVIFQKGKTDVSKKKYISAGVLGAAFAAANLLNTFLAGKLDSAVFFPVLNIGSILFSLVSGVILFKERLTKKDFTVIALGIISILLITVF